MPDVFLSYSREDQATARRFAEAFERGGLSVWWDQTLTAGEAFDEVTEKALGEARAVVVLWSKSSVVSRWVRAEAAEADEKGTLVPVQIGPCNLPIKFKLTQTADLSGWSGDPADARWQSLLAGLRRLVYTSGASQGSTRDLALPAAAPPRRFGRAWLAAGVAALLLIVAGVWLLLHRADGAQRAPGIAGGAIAAPATLAVLPFANLSSDPEQEYFSDGLSEEILNELAQNRALTLTGRTSSFAFKGKNEDLRAIGQKLGVANLLEGSVRRNGDRVRITAQLIDARSGAQQWSKTYERELRDAWALQEEIASDVARALEVRLDVGDVRRAQGGTTNVDAYDNYLRGKASMSQADWAQASAWYRKAVELDPEFGLALYGIYIAFNPLENSQPEGWEEYRAGREEFARRIEGLGQDAWWVKAVRHNQLRRARQWEQAESEGARALAEAPRSELVLPATQGILMASVGRIAEAIRIFRGVMLMDPDSRATSYLLERALHDAGRVEEAEAEFQRRQMLPGGQQLSDARADSQRGEGALLADWSLDRWPQTEAGFRHAAGATPPMVGALLNGLADTRGDVPAALALLRRAYGDPALQNGVMMGAIAAYAGGLGDADLALSALRRAHVEMRTDWTLGIWGPWLANLRGDPRFKAIVRDLGIYDYWRSTGNWGDFCRPVGTDDFECH